MAYENKIQELELKLDQMTEKFQKQADENLYYQ